MTTKEQIDMAEKRIAELRLLINHWKINDTQKTHRKSRIHRKSLEKQKAH